MDGFHPCKKIKITQRDTKEILSSMPEACREIRNQGSCRPEPTSQFDTSSPRWSEAKHVVEQVRAASAPGSNHVQYMVHKNCPRTLKLLWRLMCTAWRPRFSWLCGEFIYDLGTDPEGKVE